jgi:predicted porin
MVPAIVGLLLSLGWLAPAGASSQIYGRLNQGLEQVRRTGPDRASLSRLAAYRSVLGIRGQEDLGGGWTALWQIEGGVSTDTGAGALANRDTRVGLRQGGMLVYLGHWLTPYQQASSGHDPLYPSTVGLSTVIGNGATPSTDNSSNLSSFDRRQANTLGLQWEPAAGWTLKAAFSAPEEADRRPGFDPRLQSWALQHEGQWQGQPWSLALAYERHHDYQAPGRHDDGLKLAAGLQRGGWRFGLVLERLVYRTASARLSRKAWFGSVSRAWGPGRLIATWAEGADAKGPEDLRIGFVRGGAQTGVRQLALAYEYPFSRRTAATLMAARLRNEARGLADFGLNPVGLGPGGRADLVGLALRTAF